MKPTKLIAGLLLAITIAIPCCTLTGCGTLPERPAQTVALDSLRSTYDVSRDAYKVAVRLWDEGRITDTQLNHCTKAWNDFRAGMDVAVRAAGQDWSAPASQNVLTLKENLFNLIKNL